MTTVFKPGVFDLFHVGHLNSIRAAATQGHPLVVGVQDDRDVTAGKGRPPVVPLAHRMEIIGALSCVSDVVSYRDPFLGPLLRRLDAVVLSVGDDYGDSPGQSDTLSYCAANGITVHRVPRTDGISTTDLCRKVRDFWDRRPPNSTMLTSCGYDYSAQVRQTGREVELIAANIKPSSVVLDLGAGDGRLAAPLSRHCGRLVAVESARELAEKIHGTNVTVVVGVATRWHHEYALDKFDLVLLSGLLPYLNDSQAEFVVRIVGMVLKPTGRVFVRSTFADAARIDIINQYSPALDDFYTAYYRTPAETVELFERFGFEVLDSGDLYRDHPDTHVGYVVFRKSQES